MDDYLKNMLAKYPIYAGYDPITKEKDICWNCNEAPKKLLRCGRCRLAMYCNKKCQKLHFSAHKQYCIGTLQDLKRVQYYKQELLDEFQFPDVDEDFFEIAGGDFGEIPETRNYMSARLRYIQGIRYAANRMKTKSLWTATLNNQMDMLRLDDYDKKGFRKEVTSVLLELNRDDDCYKVIKFWFNGIREFEHEEIFDIEMDRYGNPIEGEMFSPYSLSLSHKIALVIVKMRILMAWNTHNDIVQEVLPFDPLVNQKIVGMCVYDKIDKQRKLLYKYMHMLHEHDMQILPSFTELDSLSEFRGPDYYDDIDGVEAQDNLYNYCQLMQRIPGAIQNIKQFLRKVKE